MRVENDTRRLIVARRCASCGRAGDDVECCTCGACASAAGASGVTLRRALVLVVVVAALFAWWYGVRTPAIFVAGELGGGYSGGGSDTPFLLTLISYIWSVFVSFLKWLATVLNSIVDYLIAVAKASAQGLAQLGKFFVRVWSLLRRFWTDVLRPILVKVGKLIESFRQFLARLFKPIIDVITKIRGWLQRIYKDVLRPILDIIDAFRLFLRGLGALGVDWAKELDQKLGELETKLTAPLFAAIKLVNQIAGILDRIMTLDGLFQKLIWLQSLAGYRRPTINFLWNSHSTPVDSSSLAAVKAKYKPPSVEKTSSDMREYLSFRSGDMQPKASELSQQMRIWLRNV